MEFLSTIGIKSHPGIPLSVHHMYVFGCVWNGFLVSGRAQVLVNVDVPHDIFYFYEENHINSMTWAAGLPWTVSGGSVRGSTSPILSRDRAPYACRSELKHDAEFFKVAGIVT
jgi:hypothetical protein